MCLLSESGGWLQETALRPAKFAHVTYPPTVGIIILHIYIALFFEVTQIVWMMTILS